MRKHHLEKKPGFFFIGMGLELGDLSLRGLEILRSCDEIYMDHYTNYPQQLPIIQLEKLIEKNIILVNRETLEEGSKELLSRAETQRVALLVHGDPFVATTHISIRLDANRMGLSVGVVHSNSILSVAASSIGLSAYRFGKVATVPFVENFSEYPYLVIRGNLANEAHTLLLLDIDVSKNRFLSVTEAISILENLETQRLEKVFTKNSFVIGLFNLGTDSALVRPGIPSVVTTMDWKALGPPQSLVICARSLHFQEKAALDQLWDFKQTI